MKLDFFFFKVRFRGTKDYDLKFIYDKSVIVNATGDLKVRKDNLVPGTLYEVTIQARTKKGYGPASDPEQSTVKTKIAGISFISYYCN